MGEEQDNLFVEMDSSNLDYQITAIGEKLNKLAKVLKMYPYDKHGHFQGKLKSISHTSIQPALVLCPSSTVCTTGSCNPCSLLQVTKVRDIPRVTLITHSVIHENVHVLTGRCPKCQTNYAAD